MVLSDGALALMELTGAVTAYQGLRSTLTGSWTSLARQRGRRLPLTHAIPAGPPETRRAGSCPRRGRRQVLAAAVAGLELGA